MNEAIEFCQKELGLSGDALVKCLEKFSEHSPPDGIMIAVIVIAGIALIGLLGAFIFD